MHRNTTKILSLAILSRFFGVKNNDKSIYRSIKHFISGYTLFAQRSLAFWECWGVPGASQPLHHWLSS
jgi:hypothetical protein